jgi:hypothetical protein
MTDSIEFTTPVLLVIATGSGVPGAAFPDVHRAIEHLLGQPIWTHQLGSTEPWAKARERLVAQHGGFADIVGAEYSSECKSADDVDAYAAQWTASKIEELGETFPIERGEGISDEDATRGALTSLMECAESKPVIIVT